MKSDMSEGFKELLVLEKIAQKEKNIKAKLEVLNNKAFYYFTQADYDKAYQIAKSLEKESNNINDKRLIAIAMNRLGITLNFLELYDDAEKKLFDEAAVRREFRLVVSGKMKPSDAKFSQDFLSK